jgi:hypothetical protein
MIKRLLVILLIVSSLYSCKDIEFASDPVVGGCPCNGKYRADLITLDVDDDCIIDAIEEEDFNSIALFEVGECDTDLSKAVGTPSNGSLIFGLLTPVGDYITNAFGDNITTAIDDDDGFINYYGGDPYNYDHWATHDLQSCVISAAKIWYFDHVYTFNERPMKVGDMSLEFGGPFYRFGNSTVLDHKTHQNGLDVDIRYQRFNSDQPIDIVADPNNYDSFATKELIKTIISTCNVDVIYVSKLNALGFGNEVLKTELGVTKNYLSHDASGVHDNHFHVKIL